MTERHPIHQAYAADAAITITPGMPGTWRP